MPQSPIELHGSLLFHGGDTGSTPVRDANSFSHWHPRFRRSVFGSPKFAAVRDQLVLGRGNECPEHFGPIEITVEAHSSSARNSQRQRRDHAFTELRHHDPIAIAHTSVLEHLTLLQLLTSLLLTIFAPDPSMKMAAGQPDSTRPAPRHSPHQSELLSAEHKNR